MSTRAASLLAVFALLGLAGCAHSPPADPWDPVQPVNRAVHSFNMTADEYVLRPIAQGYDQITPEPIQRSIGNFFDNARAPITIVNSVLQLKWDSFNLSLGRFMVNTTAGAGGLFDVATKIGIADPDEDLGQTLGYWGLGQGPYLVLPFLGPSAGRDAVGRAGDGYYLDPINYIESSAVQYSLQALYVLDTRASFLAFDQVLEQQFDPYIFLRTYYLKNRLEAVHDGDIPAEHLIGGGDGGDWQ